MQTTNPNPDPIFSHAEPVLAVRDVSATVKYWNEVLGFPGQWTWGSPPNHGGVSWHSAYIQFTLDAELAAKQHNQSVWIRVKHVETLYQLHQDRQVEIVMPLARQPWGFDQYMVRDINGYYVSFAAPTTSGGDKRSEPFPDNVRVVGRAISAGEYRYLAESVGWNGDATDDFIQRKIDATLFTAVAETTDSGEAIGCALVLGDGVSFYYVKDVMVHPAWQRRHIGHAIMQEVKCWLDANAPHKALVGLFTGEGLAPFYQQTDFGPAFGMIRIINRSRL